MIDLEAVKRHLEASLERYLSDLEQLVNIDSGTFDKAGVDRAGDFLRTRYANLGGAVDVRASAKHGDNFVATFTGSGTGHVLLVGHTDTVYPLGTTTSRPFRVEGGRAYGPGVADMKGGDLLIVYALEAMLQSGFDDFARIRILHNSDEEIGSIGSRDLVREQTLLADAVLVLEPGRANGDIVSARKGIVDFQLRVRGVAAHSGVNHGAGRSAALELANLVVRLEGINGTVDGATLNVGRIEGGDRPNVVPDHAFAHFEARAYDSSALDEVVRRVHAVVEVRSVEGTSVQLETQVEHPPMHKSEDTTRLVGVARAVAQRAGFSVSDVATGGASDGNTAAALGSPVLDGLGPVGGAAHSPHEYIEIGSIVPRASLLAGLVAAVGSGRW